MIVCISTSSPLCNVAIFSSSCEKLLAYQGLKAKNSCGQVLPGLLMQLLDELKAGMEDIEKIIVDVGPGSFSGVKVGAVFAKTLAYSRQISVYSISSFHLISQGPVAIPIRSNFFVLHNCGEEKNTTVFPVEIPGIKGYGHQNLDEVFPETRNLQEAMAFIQKQDVFNFKMEYQAMPSISVPKKSFTPTSS